MHDQMRELFRVALGLAAPWRISKVEFSVEQQQLDLWVDFPPGSRFACPECGRSECGAYDTSERSWRHLNFFQYKTLLHARQPRVQCPEHGVKTVEVPWSRPGSGFTLLMEAFILTLVQGGMTVAQAASLIGEHDTRLWRVLQHYVEKARAEADFSEVTTIGVDETSRRRGHNYITVFMDLEQSRVLFVTKGKDATTVERFKKDLEAHGGKPEQIEEACLDMSAAFVRGLTDQFPDAHLTFDNFHLIQLLNKAVDQVRRDERRTHPELKGTRYIWLKNPENLTDKQRARLGYLERLNLRCNRAYLLKETFREFWEYKRKGWAKRFLKKWFWWATHSRLAPMRDFAWMLRRHEEDILNYFTERISNGAVEGMNNKAKVVSHRCYGFRTAKTYITALYHCLGNLPEPNLVHRFL